MSNGRPTQYDDINSWTVQHMHGTAEFYATYEECVEALQEVYGEDIEVEGSEHEILAGHCERGLVWADEESARNDDGSRAVASIRRGSWAGRNWP